MSSARALMPFPRRGGDLPPGAAQEAGDSDQRETLDRGWIGAGDRFEQRDAERFGLVRSRAVQRRIEADIGVDLLGPEGAHAQTRDDRVQRFPPVGFPQDDASVERVLASGQPCELLARAFGGARLLEHPAGAPADLVAREDGRLRPSHGRRADLSQCVGAHRGVRIGEPHFHPRGSQRLERQAETLEKRPPVAGRRGQDQTGKSLHSAAKSSRSARWLRPERAAGLTIPARVPQAPATTAWARAAPAREGDAGDEHLDEEAEEPAARPTRPTTPSGRPFRRPRRASRGASMSR